MRDITNQEVSQKRRRIILSVFLTFIGGLALVAYMMLNNNSIAKGQTMPNNKRIILLGASVGKAWNLKDFSQRTKNGHFSFESIAFYQYDKTEALEEILMRPKRKFHLTRTYIKGFFKPSPQLPDTIILKECAAYFPGDSETYKALIEKWVVRIRTEKIGVILATVAPVTREHAETHKDRIETIWAFNDWIRRYAAQEHLPLLDLEAALRTDETSRFLNGDFTSGDGLHLNKKAYDILDRVMLDTINKTTTNPQAA
jgi:hypothetical protein